MMKSRAFTLIELLIVVAIIAILAAIAVPNFLDAQVRSKVARAKSDMRTLALAVESYYGDNNAAPLSPENPLSVSGSNWWWISLGSGEARLAGWELRLTSPVAYITKTPKDPFHTTTAWISRSTGQQDTVRARNYTYQYYNWELQYRQSFAQGNYNDLRANVYIGAVNINYPTPYTANTPRRPARGFRWGFMTTGPSLVGDMDDTAYLCQKFSTDYGFYDPSNGTKSFGYIFRTNAGEIVNDRKLW